MTGTLETPQRSSDYDDRFHKILKCDFCDSRAFALELPKDLNEYYESFEDLEQRKVLFPKLFNGPSDEGRYYHFVPVHCAKCGVTMDRISLFRLLEDLGSGDWKPRGEHKPSGVKME